MQTHRAKSLLLAACAVPVLLLLAPGARAAAFDPDSGVFGLRWGASTGQVRQAFPADPRYADKSPGLSYFGALDIGSLRLPRAGAFFNFDARGLTAVSVTADATAGPALLEIVQSRLGKPRYATYPEHKLHQHVFEWSSPSSGVRLQYTSLSLDSAVAGRADDTLYLEVMRGPLPASLVTAIEQIPAQQEEFRKRIDAADAAARTARAKAQAESNAAARLGLRSSDLGKCQFHGVQWPEDFGILVAGDHLGAPQSFQLDQSGNPATRFDVDVNSPVRPVVLMLGAYQPSVWNIRWTPGTRILAALVSGYHRQVVAGLPDTVPRLISTFDNKGPCGYFYVGEDGLERINPMARQLFGRPADRIYKASRGKVVVGEPIGAGVVMLTSPDIRPDSFADPTAPLAGRAGVDEAVRRGTLRPATQADIDAWKATALRMRPARDVPPIVGETRPGIAMPTSGETYVILRQFAIPAGLHGGHSVCFILPKGVPTPTGDLGHSALFDLATGKCEGVTCRIRGEH
jgi:hypothetical protein